MTETDSSGDRGGSVTTADGDESEADGRPTADATSTGRVAFSRSGARRGFRDCLPVAVGVAGYGVAFGVLASQAGLSAAEATLMSATVLAGAAQLLAVDLWAASASVATIVLATAAVNLRYLLLGATLRPWFADRSALETYGSAFFTADENWALTMRAFADAGATDGADGSEPTDAAYLLGSGLAIWLLWVAATVVGTLASDGVADPARYGLDAAFLAVFVAIAVDLWDGRTDLLPWTAAFVAALATAVAVPGRWYLLAGALAGGLVGVRRADAGVDSREVGG
ncbi:AzlC family ABC transporter permease [Haloterrigena sp. SYSU A121-1]|uniref:AzlC family ABC transporter permease n=1 Tax=Haloterrigena gelatinilytica TaxID=2741724 RepID=A0A8J8KEL0_9EURY|nr:AzlC family ABC transporter permease [Haloterrigena gelatinilytica]NUB90701.1 AzlC family ABC transporter permease [Haloterrigena gelatinilytica]